ncbi:TetR family transcriptional regulator [Salipaludibacillus keqinensis]|uniref:TetR family transcriptional regulator n=1 Tax=Salipaludibacillus keqinensis TaxID=2045207 RepID=A0A323THA5_9BACI|nr:TetR/AcrR family transcriptional regulator [Salipaludibacillus keqinensis]PYZ91973.1 TetR family transcriptional regulator [Salipaludibacillus keqinensis]
MSSLFENLDEEKKQRILNAAFQEFAEHGFEKASTNRIVKKAKIGKGMLFYYFNNKRELYYYLIDFSLDLVLKDYLERIDTSETDFIERLKRTAKFKLSIFAENPHLFNFIGAFVLVEKEELPLELKEKYERLYQLGHTKLYDNIDYSLFRDDIDVKKAFKLITWSIYGYEEELKQRLKRQSLAEMDYEPLFEEFYDYLEVLKISFYKQEGEKK